MHSLLQSADALRRPLSLITSQFMYSRFQRSERGILVQLLGRRDQDECPQCPGLGGRGGGRERGREGEGKGGSEGRRGGERGSEGDGEGVREGEREGEREGGRERREREGGGEEESTTMMNYIQQM